MTTHHGDGPRSHQEQRDYPSKMGTERSLNYIYSMVDLTVYCEDMFDVTHCSQHLGNQCLSYRLIN